MAYFRLISSFFPLSWQEEVQDREREKKCKSEKGNQRNKAPRIKRSEEGKAGCSEMAIVVRIPAENTQDSKQDTKSKAKETKQNVFPSVCGYVTKNEDD